MTIRVHKDQVLDTYPSKKKNLINIVSGPNAPIQWVADNIAFLCTDQERRAKILTGLNFYGNSYTPNGGGPIVGHEYIKYLEKAKGKLTYDSQSEESFFEVKYVLQ